MCFIKKSVATTSEIETKLTFMYLNANRRRPISDLYTLLTQNASICKSMTGFIKKIILSRSSMISWRKYLVFFFRGKKPPPTCNVITEWISHHRVNDGYWKIACVNVFVSLCKALVIYTRKIKQQNILLFKFFIS